MSVDLSDPDRHHLHWETALDRLELDVLHTERLLDDPEGAAPQSWDEPDLLGPIPADLVERALDLRHRQLRAHEQLTAALGTIARQHEFARRVDRATRREGTSAYVDVSA
ncbi:hypothetical protein GON03_15735 [Nocardioides sp. MAH-18]|uniref:Uncharacterized protein n=1 Tax=Nocardioides agri TaxID=2682843 RepID=A0A6L6XVX7_9ACTN|nr:MULTISPECIES: hypothetical protein [unclassified Nocardioides]MBA2955786.1 hypothetical protein [Nocardioides sp. CGMCC 1.13656]MVQ50636.1 hypothetical protein [Nocardioides sp. MAH-18]